MTLVKQIRTGAKISPYRFRFYGPINPCFLIRLVEKHNWFIPADLFELRTVYGGVNFLQLKTTMGPTANQSWQDDIYKDDRVFRANSFTVDIGARLWSVEFMGLQNFDIDEPVSILERILSQQRACLQGSRLPLVIDRALCRIIYRIRTGCQWETVPRRFGTPSAVHKRFQKWLEMGETKNIFAVFVRIYDHHKEIVREYISIDCAATKAPTGSIDAGPVPTNLKKRGSKPHIQANSCGAPVAVETSEANTDNIQLAGDVIDKLPDCFSDILRGYPSNICLDKAYCLKAIEEKLQERENSPHIPRRRETRGVGCKKREPRRWILKRAKSWHNSFRSLLIRRRHKDQRHRGLVLLASVLVMFGMVAGPLW